MSSIAWVAFAKIVPQGVMAADYRDVARELKKKSGNVIRITSSQTWINYSVDIPAILYGGPEDWRNIHLAKLAPYCVDQDIKCYTYKHTNLRHAAD
jgi:hypothetical protein